MRRTRLDEDVQPVSEFRANAAKFVRQVRETKRPLLLTQHGQGAAVLLDVEEYEEMLDTIDLLKGIAEAERQVEAGLVRDHDVVMADLMERFKGR